MAGRIIEYLNDQGVSVQSFSTENGFSKSTLGKGKEEGKSIRTDIVEKFLRQFPRVNPRWVLLGEGEMEVKSGDNLEDQKIILEQFIEKINEVDRQTIINQNDHIRLLKKQIASYEKNEAKGESELKTEAS